MKRLIFIVSLGLATQAVAQDRDGDGLSLMERGAQMLMEGLLREMEPAMDEMQGLAQEFGPALRDFTAQMGPALRGLLEDVEDWSVYEAPEMLDNGDIIIRRKPSDPVSPDETAPAPQIDI